MKNNQGERIVIGIERKVSEERSSAMMYKKASHIKNVGKKLSRVREQEVKELCILRACKHASIAGAL